jgi:bacteriocin-like protein
MKATGSTKNEKLAIKKSFDSLFAQKSIVPLNKEELKHIKGGEDEGGEEKTPVKLG